MIAPQYDCAWRFPEGEDRALVATGDGVGYIEPSGRVVIPPAPYAGRDSFSEGRALFFQYEEGHPLVSGFVDTDGRVVTRMQVEELVPRLEAIGRGDAQPPGPGEDPTGDDTDYDEDELIGELGSDDSTGADSPPGLF